LWNEIIIFWFLVLNFLLNSEKKKEIVRGLWMDAMLSMKIFEQNFREKNNRSKSGKKQQINVTDRGEKWSQIAKLALFIIAKN
jgi:hypothetical protein